MPAADAKPRDKYSRSTEPVQTSNNTKDGKPTRNAYTAKKLPYESEKSYNLADLVGENSRYQFRLVPWDGMYVVLFRSTAC